MKTKLLASALFVLLIVGTSQAQWLQQTSGTVAPLADIHCADTNVCMVVGTTTTVRKTTNGSTWNVTGTTGITSKSMVKMLNKDTAILAQLNGTFKQTQNGGTTWSADIFGGNSSFGIYDAVLVSNTDFTAVGGNATNHTTGGRINTASTNTGATWPTFVNTSGVPTLFGIHALTTTTFVACGGGANIYKTLNGGTTYTVKLNGTPNTTTLFDIHFPNDSVGYAGGGNATTPTTGGVVYKTTDRGETWVSASTGLLPNAIFGLQFVNADTGYAVGDGGFIQVTTDGGANWKKQISPVTTTLNAIHFPSKNIGYIAGAGGVILKTKTGGFIAPLIASAGADTGICNGACVTLGATAATGGTKPYQYSWSPGGQTTTSVVVCPTATSGYTLTVIDVNSDTTTDSVVVTIFPNPTISISGLASTYCNLVSSDTLFGTPAGGVFSGLGIAANDSVFNAVSAGAGTHTVTYTFTDTTGCVLKGSQTTTVLAAPTPVPICLVTVDSSMSNTENTVVWENPAVSNIDSFRIYRKNLTNPVMTLLATVPFSANSMYVDNAAGVTPTTEPHTYAITTIDTCGIESPKSDSSITMLLSAPVYTQPATFSLNWTDYDGFTFTNYDVMRTTDNGATWSVINTVAFAAGTHAYTDAGAPSLGSRYRIRAVSPAPCTVNGTTIFKQSYSNVTNDYTSVNELTLNNWLQVYPNPNHGTFKVELSGAGFEVIGVKIFNMLGETVYQAAEKKNVSNISIPGITPGVYHLEVMTDKGAAHKKMTIE